MIKGFINSFQSLGTVDGPGIRFVVFMQGCNLRCSCCHNPETWKTNVGETYTPDEVLKKVLRFKEYFGKDGGITVSGGEPLLQAKFVKELFETCKKNGINTCLDTSGSVLNDNVQDMLKVTDRVLLDIKYTDNSLYEEHVGCKLCVVLKFLDLLERYKVKTTIRQVIISDINDDEDNVKKLKDLISNYTVVDGVELLAFKNICQVKYDALNLDFKFSSVQPTRPETIARLNEILLAK